VTRAQARAAAEPDEVPAEDGSPSVRYGPLEDWVGFHLRMAQTASFAAFAREANGMAVGPGRFALLTLVASNPGISQTELSRANGRDKSTLTPALDDLERRGLVRRERVASDRRSYALTLTAAGETALAELTACAARHERNLDRIIGAEERARFLATVKRIAAELSDSQASEC
jgi:DNA-binding MarR family transcriptional regulator